MPSGSFKNELGIFTLMGICLYNLFLLPPNCQNFYFKVLIDYCGLVVRVSGYRYRGLGFDSQRYQIF